MSNNEALRLIDTQTVVTTTITRTYEVTPIIGVVQLEVNGTLGEPKLIYTGEKLKGLTSKIQALLMKAEFPELVKVGMNPYWDWAGEYGIGALTDKPTSLEDIDPTRVYFAYGSGHMMFGPDERITSLLFRGGYTNAQSDNGHYRLKSLLEHLKQHPYVVKEPREELGKYQDDAFLTIRSIESYNQSPGRDKYVDFLVLLPQEIMQTFHEIGFVQDKEFWSVRVGDYLFHPQYFPEDNPVGQLLREAGVYDPLGLLPFQKKRK